MSPTKNVITIEDDDTWEMPTDLSTPKKEPITIKDESDSGIDNWNENTEAASDNARQDWLSNHATKPEDEGPTIDEMLIEKSYDMVEQAMKLQYGIHTLKKEVLKMETPEIEPIRELVSQLASHENQFNRLIGDLIYNRQLLLSVCDERFPYYNPHRYY